MVSHDLKAYAKDHD